MGKWTSWAVGPLIVIVYGVSLYLGVESFQPVSLGVGFFFGTWTIGALLRLHAWAEKTEKQ